MPHEPKSRTPLGLGLDLSRLKVAVTLSPVRTHLYRASGPRRNDFLRIKMRNARCGFPTASGQRFGKDQLCKDDSANYPRREPGGARPPCKSQGPVSGVKHATETSSRPASGAASHTALATTAGGPCSRFTQAEFLSLPACRTVRLLLADSSISARIACKSSDAEITGNSRTSTHPSASKHCSAVIRRPSRDLASRRHSQ